MTSTARSQIVEITVEELLTGGVAGCTLNQIIKRSGLSKGAFYHYFRSKEDLLGAVVDEPLAREMNKIWLKPLARSGAGWSELCRILQREAQNCAAAGGVSALFLVFVHNCNLLDEANQQKLSIIQGNWSKRLERVFRQAAQSGEIQTSGLERSAAWIVLGVFASAFALSKQDYSGSVKKDLLRSWTSVFEAL